MRVVGAVTQAIAVCRNHLSLLGVASAGDGLSCTIGWGADAQREEDVQAASGLVEVHSRDLMEPRRLGLDVSSVAAGIVATQGVLAALLARHRGLPVGAINTSALQAALLYVCHHLAIATSDGQFPFDVARFLSGPPFRTLDGDWVEIEVLGAEDWISFWKELGVEGADVVGSAWLPFVYRYLAGRCGLPPDLHEATRRRTTDQLRSIAVKSGVALCRVRSHVEVDAKAAAPWTFRPNPIPSPSTRMCPSADTDSPLGGLRVIEAGSRLQGPLASLLLGQLGAEVIKVEPPGGDFGRGSPPLAGSTGAAYLAYNRGKSVVEIDYKRPEGRAELVDLITESDVFLHNWRPGRAEALGLDFDQVGQANPQLVYAWLSGWGALPDPPSQIAGDYLVQAYAGCGDLLHPPGEPPVPSRLTLIDTTGGLLACEGILAGLYRRELTGRGCRVDTSLLAAASHLIAHSSPRWATAERLDVTRLADMPSDPRFGGLLELVPHACWVPAAPWRFSRGSSK